MPEEDETDEREKLIANERSKLTATYLNGTAVALIAVGGFAPFLSARETLGRGEGDPLVLAISITLCIGASGALHFLARFVLKGLR